MKLELHLEIKFGPYRSKGGQSIQVDEKVFRLRAMRLISMAWEDSNKKHPAAENFLISARHLLREAAAWSLATKVELLDYSDAKALVLLDSIKIKFAPPPEDFDEA